MASSARSPVRCGHGAAAMNVSSEPGPGLALDVVVSPYQRAMPAGAPPRAVWGAKTPFWSGDCAVVRVSSPKLRARELGLALVQEGRNALLGVG